MSDSKGDGGRRYVLHSGLSQAFEEDDDCGCWASFVDPDRLKRYATELGLPPTTRIMVELNDAGALGSPGHRIVCTLADVARWRPKSSPLPDGHPERPARPSRASSRLRLFGAIRSALDQAVADDLLTCSDAEAMMLAIDQFVARPVTDLANDPVVLLAKLLSTGNHDE